MTEGATLVLAGSREAGSVPATTVVLGLPVVRRAALAAKRAGFDRVYVLDDEKAVGPALEGTGARVFPRDAAEASLPHGRIVLLSDRIVASPDELRLLRRATVQAEQLCRLQGGAGAVIETSAPAALAPALASASDLSTVLAGWASALPAGDSSALPAPPFEVATEASVAPAEEHLLKALVKEHDSTITKLINRRVSLAVTRRLASTPVTPNAMTFFCVGLGLLAAWCFASPEPFPQFAGGVLFLLHSILDGCDGELARLKFQESRFGGALDFWGDNVVHVAVFAAMAIAWSTAVGESWPLLLGAIAVSATILSAAFIYLYAMRPRAGGGPLLTTISPSRRSRFTEVLDETSRRDFIYVVLALTLFGKGYWFVAGAAVGTPIFFTALLVMALVARPARGTERGPLLATGSSGTERSARTTYGS